MLVKLVRCPSRKRAITKDSVLSLGSIGCLMFARHNTWKVITSYVSLISFA